MQSNHERKAMDCLFEGQDVKLYNLKFFRGTDYSIPEDRFQEVFCESMARRDSAKASVSSVPPKCFKAPIDLRALVAEM
jgi:hypothetical protein